jgi:hypothetical protein
MRDDGRLIQDRNIKQDDRVCISRNGYNLDLDYAGLELTVYKDRIL